MESEIYLMVSVAGTKTKLLLGVDGIFLQNEDNLEKIPNIEHLFKNNLLIDWFNVFCTTKEPCLTVSVSERSMNSPSTYIKTENIPFSPSNPLHWHTFCRYFFFLDLQNADDTSKTRMENVEEEEDTLKGACKLQFNDFIQNELQILLLQLQKLRACLE